MPLSRRRLLAVGGSSLAIATAGCKGGSGDDDKTPPRDQTDTATETPRETETETETPTEPDCDPTQVDGEITSDTTWGEECASVELTGYVTVTDAATLTIQPGVTVTAQSETGLRVEDGTLDAAGTAEAPIRFQGSSAVPGHWDGIEVQSNTPNELAYVQVAHAGSGDYAVDLSGRASLTNSTVASSAGYGMRIQSSSTVEAFSANTLRDNENAGLTVHVSQLGALDGASTYADGNGEDYILVDEATVTEDATWPAPDAPFYIDNGGFDIEAEVTINPGASFRFAENSGITVSSGYLDAQGESGNRVTFDAEVDAPGYWDGLYFDSNNPSNSLAYTTVSYAPDGVTVDGYLSVTDTTVSNCSEYGIEINDGSTIPEFARNELSANGEAPIQVPADLVGSLDSETTYASDNEHDRIELSGTDIETAQTWSAMDAPYFCGDLSIDAELTIDPGATLQFQDGHHMNVEEGDGKLVADASDSDGEITFEGKNEAPGYWGGIDVNSADQGNLLDGVDIGYAAGGIYVGNGATLTVRNSSIHDMSDDGIYVDRNGTLTASGNTFENIEDEDIDRQE